MKKILLIVNPFSGEKQGMEMADKIEKVLQKHYLKINRYETTGNDDFHQLTKETFEAGFKKVIIFGGDGTISEYVKAISNLRQRPEIILIPTGTRNNLARALNTELDMDTILSKMEEHIFVKRKADVGQVNNDYFISTLSAGTIPEMSWKTDDDLKEKLGSFAYVLEGISVLGEDDTFHLTIETDSGTTLLEDVVLLVIGLSNSVFGISSFFEEAKINDGKLHLYALKKSNLLNESASLANDVFSSSTQNEEDKNDESYTTSFVNATVDSSETMHLAMDGEKGPMFPIELNVLHNHLTFLVPEAEN